MPPWRRRSSTTTTPTRSTADRGQRAPGATLTDYLTHQDYYGKPIESDPDVVVIDGVRVTLARPVRCADCHWFDRRPDHDHIGHCLAMNPSRSSACGTPTGGPASASSGARHDDGDLKDKRTSEALRRPAAGSSGAAARRATAGHGRGAARDGRPDRARSHLAWPAWTDTSMTRQRNISGSQPLTSRGGANFPCCGAAEEPKRLGSSPCPPRAASKGRGVLATDSPAFS